MKTAFLVAAPASGSGKTTISLGLMALFRQKGYTVQPFKCGPDYIDTKFHEQVCGRPSINLDTFMASAEHVSELFWHYGADADVCIVEGMMGLYDGYDRDRGSSADVARVLGLPVVLVVDARSAAYSMAPLLRGFLDFRRDVRIAGVVFNKVGSERHYNALRQVCADVGVTCLGYLPKTAAIANGSRYLGLDFSERVQATALTSALDRNIDLAALTQLGSLGVQPPVSQERHVAVANLNVLVARNAEAFSFVYQEVIDSLGRVKFYDPETEVPNLDGIDLLYLPGGYPEKHMEALSANTVALRAVYDFAEKGGCIVAECGGMMYLCEKIVTDDGEYPLCGVLPYAVTARQAERRLTLGYRRFELDGCELRGHEFHYTQFVGQQPPSVAQVYKATGEQVDTPVIRLKNVLASYTHLYSIADLAVRLVGRQPLTPVPAEQHCPPTDAATGTGPQLSPLMFVGTGSDVGKSVLATAFCRIFRQDGYSPAPFKAQNMSLNSYVTREGLEMGRAQVVQAEAAGIPCHTDMNPILLKPQSDHTSQVVLHGRPVGSQTAGSYFRQEGRDALRREVEQAFDRLAARFRPIVMEGAGSISEINLRKTDLVNMSMAQYAKANVILVADIDRGGVFASLYGSVMLLPPSERRLIKGIIINKFRGDIKLFEEGARMIERLCHVPVLGVVPYFQDIQIEAEDSVSLDRKPTAPGVSGPSGAKVSVCVVLLRHISNFTDFDVLERDPRVHLYYTSSASDVAEADVVILPGSKSTIDDLYHLRRSGMAEAIVAARRRGATVLGICGGYQMMGREVSDPRHVEGEVENMPGLGLLPVTTVMEGEKHTRQVTCQYGTGYEIHMGTTTPLATPSPLVTFTDGTVDGYIVDEHCMGTYVHGILDNPAFIDKLLAPFADRLDEQPAFDYAAFKERQYDLLAAHVRSHVDVEAIYRLLNDKV